MTTSLTVHFVDGSDAEINITFDEKQVEMTAFDEKTRQWYHLTFAKCISITVVYSDEGNQWVDLNNLTEGIRELAAPGKGARNFEIGFADESMLQISCRDFSIEPISKPMARE